MHSHTHNIKFSRVIALRVRVNEGRWLVETESGYFPDGFHSYIAPTKKTLGPYQTREIAVGVGKRQVCKVYGISWGEVVSGGDFETVADSSVRWEVLWSPPDSEYSRVVVKLVGSALTHIDGNNSTKDMEVEEDEDVDEYHCMYQTAAF
ncbi:hypothetical protein BWQ96_07846 [Gracilariopsis chorda]|uniref:Uncharacterized protein n=1 Tax=Gracilariopsis chorda TaxID=448386 RepID=A0A2V3IK15_9FLOR|nr:hypothetical protein BWQ96_07846 [Gracilariopsis chorda]|eukprot:PXF42435.1 hypothetical protein BWQ96_07846 [Gracilariopsis chorda]